MTCRAKLNLRRLSRTAARQHRAPVLLFAKGLPEICALLLNGSVIGYEVSA
jgi:hypothetical protein